MDFFPFLLLSFFSYTILSSSLIICEDAKNKSNEIEIIKLKYECLKDEIYNDKEFDELIDIAKKRKDEIINDELEDIKEQKNDLEDFKKQSKKRLDNLKEKNNAEIQKKQIELQNHKLREYNKLLLEKKKIRKRKNPK